MSAITPPEERTTAMKTHAEVDLDISLNMEVVAYHGELRIEFDKSGSSLVMCITEDMVEKLSAMFPAALAELKTVRENPKYEHRLVRVPSL
jgi:hypothetical protein